MTRYLLSVASLMALFVSCSPYVGVTLTSIAPPLSADQQVVVITGDAPLPEDAYVIGEFNIDDTGFTTNCTYEDVVGLARKEARKAGANAIRITRHLQTGPPPGNSCHRISGLLLYWPDAGHSVYAQAGAPQQPSPPTALAGSVSSDNCYPRSLSEQETRLLKDKNLPRWRIGIDGAYAHRIGGLLPGLAPEARQFLEKTLNGTSVGADAHYFMGNSFGIGLRTMYNHYEGRQTEMRNEVSMLFAGPSVMFRTADRRGRNIMYCDASLGFALHDQDVKLERHIANSVHVVGAGSILGLGYDLRLGHSKSFVGFRLSFIAASATTDITDFTTGKKSRKHREDMSAVQAGLGLRF